MNSSPIEHFEHGRMHDAVIALCRGGIEPFSQDAKKLHAMAVLDRGELDPAFEILGTCSDEDSQVQKMYGYVAFKKGDLSTAIRHYERAVSMNPAYPEALHDLGVAYDHVGRVEDAKAMLTECVRLRPDWPLPRMDLGIVKLNAKDESGWKDYEARHMANGTLVDYAEPHWEGEDVAGKRFFLLCEQGFGDQIQYLRYAKLLADQGARVLVGVSETLKRWANVQAGASEIYVMGGPINKFDVWAYSMSMPRVTGSITTMGAPSARLARRGKGRGFVGLAWRGNPQHKGDRYRSIPFRAFEPITKDYKCLSFQFAPKPGEHDLFDATQGCFDFLDTAMKMLDECDAMVTCDTSIAHLAGSIGIPTVLLLPEIMDYRWRIAPPEFYYPCVRHVVNTSSWDETMAKAREVLKDIV